MTNPQAAAPAGRTRPPVKILWLLATALLAAMPAVMALAHRSSPLILSLAAGAALAAALAEGRGAHLAREAGRILRQPLALASLGFLVWAALSTGWSDAPMASLRSFGEFGVSIAAAAILALLLPSRMPTQAGWFLAGGIVIACFIILFDLGTGMAARRALGMRWNSFVLNRPSLTLLVLAPPMLLLLARGRWSWLAVPAAALVALTILKSESGAAKLGLVVGVLAFALALAWSRIALAALAAAILASLAIGPVFGEAAERLLPPAAYERLATAHARDRVDIWRSYGAAIREAPIAGAGFGQSAQLDRTRLAERVAPEYRTLLGVGHPHNAPIQVWVELGAMGAFLAGLVVVLMLRTLADKTPFERRAQIGMAAAILAVSLVGHGAWQGWWAAAIGAALVWFRLGRSGAEAER